MIMGFIRPMNRIAFTSQPSSPASNSTSMGMLMAIFQRCRPTTIDFGVCFKQSVWAPPRYHKSVGQSLYYLPLPQTHSNHSLGSYDPSLSALLLQQETASTHRATNCCPILGLSFAPIPRSYAPLPRLLCIVAGLISYTAPPTQRLHYWNPSL